MRNKDKFKKDLTNAFKNAEIKAINASYKDIVNEDDSVESIANKMAKHVGEVYSKELGPELSKIIDNYLDSLVFDITKLTAPNGPVTGEITIK